MWKGFLNSNWHDRIFILLIIFTVGGVLYMLLYILLYFMYYFEVPVITTCFGWLFS